ncbi:MAG: hypothetical protein AAB766_00315, partial [Patescibacteria group bacterium]
MKKLQFEEIIKSAWQLAIKSRLLWFFGIFTGGGMMMSFQTDQLDVKSLNFSEMMKRFLEAIKEPLFLWTLIIAWLLFVVALIISFVARAAMLHGIDEKSKSGVVGSFKQLLKFGFSKSLRVILMELIYFIPNVVLGSLLVLFLIYLPTEALGLVIIIALVLFFIYFLVISFFRGYSYCFLVFEDESPWTAIKSGWKLLMNNFGELITAGVLKMALLIGAGLATLIALVAAALPLLLVGALVLIFVGNTGLYVLIGLGLFALLVVFMIIRGFLNTFFYAYTVFVYRRLTGK